MRTDKKYMGNKIQSRYPRKRTKTQTVKGHGYPPFFPRIKTKVFSAFSVPPHLFIHSLTIIY